jgi:transposase
MGSWGRPKAELVLSNDERATLERWVRRSTIQQSLALRSKIVLACAKGLTNTDVAERLGVNEATVSKWRSRFVARRLEGLADEPRPGAPRTVTDDHVERVVLKTLTNKPKDATH